MQRLCVYCGSKAGQDAVYSQTAQQLAAVMIDRGQGLVFGGGSVGLMGVMADAILAAGGEVIGVIPQFLATRELLHPGVPDMRVVASMHERKALMAELADGFLALPGGFGTFEELLETITWAQLGLHRKPIGLLNTAGYFDPLVAMFDQAVDVGFLAAHHRGLYVVESEPAALLDRLATHVMPEVPLRMQAKET